MGERCDVGDSVIKASVFGRAGSAKKRGGGPVKIVALEGRSDPGVFLGTSPIKTHLRHHDFDSDEHTLTRDGGGPFP